MTCTLSPSVSWSYNNTRSHVNGYDDLSQSQLFFPGSFSFIDVVTTEDSSSSSLSTKSSRRTVRETKLQRQNLASSRSQLKALLDKYQNGKLRKENDENFASFWSSAVHPQLHGDGVTGSRLRQRRVAEAGPRITLEDLSSHHHHHSHTSSTSSAAISATHPDPQPPATCQRQQRCLLIPPRPRLSSLTPHPHAPQSGPDLRRPLPNKRRRTEVPLLKKALVNSSNAQKVIAQSSSRSMLSKDNAQDQNQSGSVSVKCQGCTRHDDVDVLCSNSQTEFESEVESELSSSWVYIPLIPPISSSFNDDWEFILKGELYQ